MQAEYATVEKLIISEHVASAVDAQTAATSEIAQNVEQAFAGIRDITQSVHVVTANAGETAKQAAVTKSGSVDLSSQSARMAREIRSFIMTMREGLFDRRKFDDPNYKGPERRAERAARNDQISAGAGRPGTTSQQKTAA